MGNAGLTGFTESVTRTSPYRHGGIEVALLRATGGLVPVELV
jgi:hypothetical protein